MTKITANAPSHGTQFDIALVKPALRSHPTD